MTLAHGPVLDATDEAPHARVDQAPVPQEAVKAKAAVPRLLQTIDLRQNRTTAVVTALVVCVVAASLASLWFGRFAQTETTRGIVAATGGFARLDAPRAGVISKFYVGQGDHVTAGQPVYALRIGTETAEGQSAVDAEIRNLSRSRIALQEEIARATDFIARAKDQQQTIVGEQGSFYAGLADQAKATTTAADKSRATVRRLAAYVKDGYATRDLLEAHERTTFEYERQLSEVRLKRLEYQRQDAERQRLFETLIATKLSERSASQSQIETIDSRLAVLKTESSIEVQAQAAGEVVAVTAKVGDSVRVGQFVAAVGDPDATPVIVVDAPSRAIGLAKVGQSVIIKYDAFPFKTFGIYHGTITYISSAAVRSPVSGADEKLDPGLDPRPNPGQSAYRIEIQPDRPNVEAYGELVPLKIGSSLTADIVIERRRLLDWVLDPIRALRGR